MTADHATETAISAYQLLGTGLFGAVVGWYLYYVNRHRKDTIQVGDVVTLIGAIGGGAVLGLFDKRSELLGAYGIGLGVGFFGYFTLLVCFVKMSKGRFRVDWFLDGRRKDPEVGWGYSGVAQIPMMMRSRPLSSPAPRLPLALAAPTAVATPAAATTAPIADTRVEVREIAKTQGVKAQVVIGNAQPGGWIAALDGAVVGSSSGANPLALTSPLPGKVFEVSATMKATVPESGRLSLQVVLRDDTGTDLGAPITIEHAAALGDAAAYSIIVVFTEAA